MHTQLDLNLVRVALTIDKRPQVGVGTISGMLRSIYLRVKKK